LSIISHLVEDGSGGREIGLVPGTKGVFIWCPDVLTYHLERGAVHNPIQHNFAALSASIELADSAVGTLHRTVKEYLGHYDP
jgi:hypothetical protein